ncbi:MAG TPA: twin-arginine translocase TatA/TatE family subunit [Armatimonadetes bacterium]|jgi:sec-independent protein translocase protein TatA|nr:twin-arginine translocase TatA/TatE family subunit [Armatimonadota bacterium]
MSFPGLYELIVIGIVVLLLFGGGKVKEFMRAFGEGLREFRSAATEATTTIREAVDGDPAPPSTAKADGEAKEPPESPVG